MLNKLHDKICKINCITEDIDSLYHQAALKLGVSDSVLFVLYMIYTSGEQCLLYDIYKLSGICKQTINSAIRKLENEDIVYLEKQKGKAKIVCLTDKGKSYIKQNAAKLFEAECNAFSDWSEEELNLYLSLMEKHNVSLRKQIQNL
ncbi:MAG: MarR family winged helix-turn-helix transcriptional regulator [Muricoprocola sp.]